MITDVWTLTVGGVTKSPTDWGFYSDLEFNFFNKEKSSATVTTTDDFDSADKFTYGTKAVFALNGTPFFVCFVAEQTRVCDEGKESVRYTFYDLWWFMQRLVFKQQRKQWGGWIGNDPKNGPQIVLSYSSEVYIGEGLDVNGTFPQVSGDQIKEVLNWLNECYNPTKQGSTSGRDDSKDVVKIGQIDPTVLTPKSMVNDAFCSDMVVNLLRWSPDAVVAIDHTTDPPTFNIFKQANQQQVALAWTKNGTANPRSVTITPKYDRQLDGVLIYYKSSLSQDGFSFPTLVIDKFPLNITEFMPDVSTHTISLSGGSSNSVKTNIVTADFISVFTGTDAQRVAWLKARDLSLQDTKIDPASVRVLPGTFAVLDDNDLPLTSLDIGAVPNEVIDTPLFDWMGVNQRTVTVVAQVTFDKYRTDYVPGGNNIPIETINEPGHRIHRKVTLTNAITQTYANTSTVSGESPPTGVAEEVYNSVKDLKFEGSVTLVGENTRTDIKLGCSLTIDTDAHAFTLLPVQHVKVRPHFGEVVVDFGPSSVLDAEDLVELIRTTRLARYFLPSGRGDINGPTAAQVAL